METNIHEPNHPPFFIRGYKVVYHPEHKTNSGFVTHPGYIYEHRYVMEKVIGRPLTRGESVHHKDGNKSNNTIENLELLSRCEHSRLHSKERAKKLGHHLKEEKLCRRCGSPTSKYGTLCGKCSLEDSHRIKLPPLDEFQRMIDNSTLEDVARVVGVSSNAVRKWIKKLGLHYTPKKQKGNKDNLINPLIRERAFASSRKYKQEHPYQYPSPIIQISKGGEIVHQFRRPAELREYGFNDKVCVLVARGLKPSYKGFHWKFNNAE